MLSVNIKKISLGEFLFYIGFIPYLTLATLATTMFSSPSILMNISKALLLFPLLGFLLRKSWNVVILLPAFFLLVLSFMIWRQTGNTNGFEVALLIIGAYQLESRRILKNYLAIVGGIIFLAFIASKIGIIENLQYVRPDTGAVRNSFGVIYPTDFASHIFFLYLASAYLYFKRFPKSMTSVGFMLAFILIKYCDARLDAYTLLGAVLLFLTSSFWSRSILKFSLLVPSISIFLSYYLTLNYTGGSIFYNYLNKVLSGRLYLGQKALYTYGLNWFGQDIYFIGNGGSVQKVFNYNFVDSSYIKIALLSGIIFLGVLGLMLIIQTFKAIDRDDRIYVMVLIAIAVNSMVAHHLAEVTYNIFVILLWSLFETSNFGNENHVPNEL